MSTVTYEEEVVCATASGTDITDVPTPRSSERRRNYARHLDLTGQPRSPTEN